MSMNTPAEKLVRALGGQWHGASGTARCPAHWDRVPSLSVGDALGKVLFHCHAGCSQAEVIAALRGRGLWGRGRLAVAPIRADKRQRHTQADDVSAGRRTEIARRIWAEAQPAAGSLVETYLNTRGIRLPVPDSLRFHPGLRHRSGIYPAMVGLVTRGTDDEPIGIHRTFLSADGRGKAPVTPQKMMLGPCRGGAVRLGPAANPLMVGEGIETCLAAMQATGWSAWAALSTSGLRSLDLPATVRDIIILADGDAAGEAAANAAAIRWRRGGRRVRIARPPAGTDFNDVLMGLEPKGEHDCRDRKQDL
jgi:putative DNA primase/helicase